MAYDEALAERIRELVATQPNLTEQKMFGGLGFMIGGHMAVAASGQGGLMVRVDPDGAADLLQDGTARPMEMRGREMAGWLRVDANAVATRRQLEKWVTIGTTYVRSLPPKRKAK
jgi:TfoX/Sxy family transcriptional regulator of competence genes